MYMFGVTGMLAKNRVTGFYSISKAVLIDPRSTNDVLGLARWRSALPTDPLASSCFITGVLSASI